MTESFTDMPRDLGFSRRHTEGIFHKLFGCEISAISERVILSPVFAEPYFTPYLEKVRAKGKGLIASWIEGTFNKIDVTVIKTNWMGSMLGDLVLLLGHSPCKTLIFCGTAAAIKEEILVEDFIVPRKAWIGEGFSMYYKNRGLAMHMNKNHFSEPDLRRRKDICSILFEHYPAFYEGDIFTVGSLMAENNRFIQRLLDLGIEGIDMEASAIFSAANVVDIHAVAIHIVSEKMPCSEFEIPFIHSCHKRLAQKACPLCLTCIVNI